MIVKLAIRNIKKSIKDYSIYFLTLTLTIAIFYIFNSFSDLSIIQNFNSYKKEIVLILTILINVVSVFIAVVFAFVIIYANNFIIKKRNKEFATYLLLGMPKSKVSKMLFSETLIVGILSLVVGLIVGVLFSQVFCFLVAKIFTIPLELVGFSFSIKSLIYTSLLFAGMYIVVAIFGSISIAKSKLINLINSNRKNEKVAKSIGVKGILFFICSLALLFYGYYLVLNNGLVMIDGRFWLMCLCGALGTIGIYLFLSQIFMYLIPKFKKMYYRKANMFVAKQIGNKINTNGMLLGIISLMIFLSICSLSAGLGMNDYSNLQIETYMPYDVYVSAGNNKSGYDNVDFSKYEQAMLDKGAKIEESLIYSYNSLNMFDKDFSKNKLTEEEASGYNNVVIMKNSDFNKLQKIINSDLILNLKDNEYVMIRNNAIKFGIKIDELKGVKIGDVLLTPQSEKVINDKRINTSLYGLTNYFIVVDDNSYEKFDNISYHGGKDAYIAKIKGGITEEQAMALDEAVKLDRNDTTNNLAIYSSENIIAMKTANLGMSISLVFIGVYISIVFVISSAALLAIQQLSDASDHKYRFNTLEKLGADSKLINKLIFKQILIYFVAPLIMAIISSLIGVKAFEKTVTGFGQNLSLVMPYLITIGLLAIIYLIYFIATFYGYKSIVKVKEREL